MSGLRGNTFGFLQQIKQYLSSVLQSPVRFFIVAAGFFGLLFILLAPPLTGADEEAHFTRAYAISNGDFILNDTNKVEVPKSYRKTIGCYQSDSAVPGKTYSYRFDEYGNTKKESLKCALSTPLNDNERELVRTSAGPYSPTTYIPQVAAIAIGRAINAPVVVIATMVRIFTLVAYMALIVLAIRTIPVRKWALAGVALLPHSIIQITNPGGDYLLLGVIALLVAVIVRSVYVKKIELHKSDKVWLPILALSSIAMVLPKGPFPGLLFIPLIFFYGGFKHRIGYKILIAIVSLAVSFLWYKFGASVVLPWRTVSDTTSILDLPYAFIKTMFYGWVETDFVQVGSHIRTGFYSGLPSIIITILNILLAIYMFVAYPENRKATISRKHLKLMSWIGYIIAIGVILGSFAALYMGVPYSQRADMIIMGVQARYFYPAFIMLAMLPLIRPYTASVFSYRKTVIIGSIVVLASLSMTIALAFQWIII